MIDRRSVVAFLALAPVGALAQSARAPRIGFLSVGTKSPRVEAFLKGLRELGYVEGKNIVIDWRLTGEMNALGRLADDLVRSKPDLIVAAHPQAVDAVRRLTSTIPIVFAVGQDPVGMGFAKSLARPGGNITGHSSMSADMGSKHVELLKGVLPNCTRVAVLLDPTNAAGTAILRKSYETAAEKLRVNLAFVDASSKEELEPAIRATKAGGAQAIIVTPDGLLFQHTALIADAATRNGLPSLFFQPDAAIAGGLVAYGPDGREQYRRAASYVHRILNGAKPGDLPIEQPSKFEMVLNLKTAKTLGLQVPAPAIARADQVIR